MSRERTGDPGARVRRRGPSWLPRTAAALLAILLPASAGAETFPIAVRCGRSDPLVKPALPDLPFDTGRGYGAIGGHPGRLEGVAVRGAPADEPVTWREGSLKYVFRLPAGRYLVVLGFVETDVAHEGLRVFEVIVEEETVIPKLDVYAEAGDFAWLERSFIAAVYDGWLDLRLVALTGDREPRLASITVTPWREPDGPAELPAPVAGGRAALLANALAWNMPPGGGVQAISEYGVFRADSPEGPFERVASLHVPHWTDMDVAAGTTTYYRVRAYGAGGGESPFSDPVAVAGRGSDLSGLPAYDVSIAPEALRRVAVRSDPMPSAPGELVFHDQRFAAEVRFDGRRGRWHRQKTLEIDMSADPYRAFRKRRELRLSAEPGDFTRLREALSHDAAGLLGLATPLVEPACVRVNGRFIGLRYDIERLGDSFRRRTGLDRVGLMAQLLSDDHWSESWEPRGRRVGEGGDIVLLNELAGELNRLHPGEMPAYFEERFYLDRLIDRLAFAAARGELDLPHSSRYLLRDSRNGRWELFQEEYRSRDWGIAEFETEIAALGDAEVERVLFPSCQRTGAPKRESWLVLYTRFFHVPELRERYLERLESLLDGELAPERVEAIATAAFERVREAVLLEPERWPFDGGGSFLAAPGRIAAAHRARAQALREHIARERSRPEEPVVLGTWCLRPRDGDPWVEVRNRSTGPVALSSYRLSESFSRTGRVVSADAELAAGSSFRIGLGRGAPAGGREGGGLLVLWRRDALGRAVLADFEYYGYQTEGIACERDAERPEGWTFVRDAGGEEPASGFETLETPPAGYRQSVVKRENGDLEISLQVPAPAEGPRAVAEVVLRYRPADADAYEEVRMVWDATRFRYSLVLEHDAGRPRTAYYFLARSASGLERAYPLGAPAATFYLPVLPQVVINEVCPRPGFGPDAPGEFIEIHNPADEYVDLGGFHLTDDRRRPTKWRIPEGTLIRPKGYAVLYADGLDRGLHASFKLANSGEYLGLYGRPEEGALLIDACAFRGVPLGQSWGRKQDGTGGFRVWKDPTPGTRNLPRIPKGSLENHGR